jgi:hypothetical protein
MAREGICDSMAELKSFSKFAGASSLVQPSVEGLPFGGCVILSGSAFYGRPPLWRLMPTIPIYQVCKIFKLLW